MVFYAHQMTIRKTSGIPWGIASSTWIGFLLFLPMDTAGRASGF